MYLQTLATAVPDAAYSQADCWEIVKNSPVRQRLNRRSMLMLQAILRGDSGVQRRHFAVPDVGRIFDLTADELNAAYREAAPALAARALQRALAADGSAPAELAALFICSCTGYLCPGVTSYVAERMGVRSDAFLLDVVGHGCGAAVPAMRAASDFVAAHPGALVAVVAVEICSAAFYIDDDPGVIVSACIFADGAAATLWRSRGGRSGLRCGRFHTLHRPEARDHLRFEQREGKLRNLLHATVPQVAAEAVEVLRAAEMQAGGPVGRLVLHPGGRDVLDAVERRLGAADLSPSRWVLANYGNMSSPSVLFALERALATDAGGAGDDWMLASFGAGFSAHSCRLAFVPERRPLEPAAPGRADPAIHVSAR
ncbi:MAG TPA: 3-oxoacyl-[acyl-carrier-protein] synthase III C-terminal domain-containing protein [Opitutaceae bacterium]|nr:3-oxoacyl-[acyl-carrier-protein] synthase III C-terminal domain-containing protein [Opitutaceae bacterium]